MSHASPKRIGEVVKPAQCAAGLTSATREEVLAQIARLAVQGGSLDAAWEEAILAALQEREAIGTTGFGQGIAIPHCRLDGIESFVVGVVTIPDGVDFGSLDGEPVRVFVYIIAPRSDNGTHVRLLSQVSRALMAPGAVDEIVSAAEAESLCELFLGFVKDDDDLPESSEKNLFHIVVQDEDLFRDILQVFTSLDAHSIVVLEGQPPSAYLGHMPLFADLWSDDSRRFCRVIMAFLNRKLSNEAIRRIEESAGPLSQSRDVLVSVQEILHSAGSLNV